MLATTSAMIGKKDNPEEPAWRAQMSGGIIGSVRIEQVEQQQRQSVSRQQAPVCRSSVGFTRSPSNGGNDSSRDGGRWQRDSCISLASNLRSDLQVGSVVQPGFCMMAGQTVQAGGRV